MKRAVIVAKGCCVYVRGVFLGKFIQATLAMKPELTTIEGHHPATLSSQKHWEQFRQPGLLNWGHTLMLHLERLAWQPLLLQEAVLPVVPYRQMFVACVAVGAELLVGAFLVALPVARRLQFVVKDLGEIVRLFGVG